MLGPMENLRKLTKIHFLPIRDICPSHKASTYTILKQDMMGVLTCQSFPGGSSGKESACQLRRCKRHSLIPRSGRSPGGGNGNPFQHSCLENPMNRGDWRVIVHSVAKSQTRLKQISMHTNKIVNV